MATEAQLGIAGLHLVGVENLRKRWGWFLVMLGLAAKKLPSGGRVL